MALPEKDQLTHARVALESRIAMAFGGRIAEEMIFGKENITTGAGNDILQATRMARRMVTEFGFSDKLGPLHYEGNEEEVFLGHSVTQRKNVSEATAALIDEEVRRFVEAGEETARRVLAEHHDDLETLAQALLEYETLSGDEVKALLRGEPIVRPDPDEPSQDGPARSSVPTSGSSTKRPDDDAPDMELEPQPGT